MTTMYENLCGNCAGRIESWDRVDISLTVHSRAVLKIVKSMCNGIKKITCTLMKCHTNVNFTPFTQLPHKFSLHVVTVARKKPRLLKKNLQKPLLFLKYESLLLMTILAKGSYN
jgi:hypothetical protein